MNVIYYSTSAEDLFRYRLPVAVHLEEAGYSVSYAGPGGEYAARLEQTGATYHRIPPALEGMPVLDDALASLYLTWLYRKVRPDIVHHFTLKGIVRGGVAARLARIEWVVQSIPSLHEPYHRTHLLRSGGVRLLRFALKHAEVTFRTHHDRQQLLAIDAVRPEQTHILSSSGIDLSAHPYVPEPDRRPVAALFGPLGERDAIDAFVAAARLLRNRGVDARFVLVTTRPEAPPVTQAELDRWQEEGLIEWWGRRRDETHVLGVVHVACVTESYESEVPELLLEAAAAGRPLIATDDPAVRHLVRDDETGRIVPRDDPHALADALEAMLDDPERRVCMGQNARRLVEREFSADRVAQQTMAVYERLYMKGRGV